MLAVFYPTFSFDAKLSGFRDSNGILCCQGNFGNFWSKDGDAGSGYYMDFNNMNSKVAEQMFDKNKKGFLIKMLN